MTQWSVLSNGHGIGEAPVMDGDGGLYFSDIQGGVYHLAAGTTETRTIIPKRKGVGGMALHKDGGVVVAGRDIVHVEGGESRQLCGAADVPTPPGITTSFNDFAVGGGGELYLGTVKLDADGRRAPGELVELAAPHRARVVLEGVYGANGAVVTRDGRVFQVDSEARCVRMVDARGNDPSPPQMFSTAAIDGVPDGMALDEDENLWIAFYGGGCLTAWSPAGQMIERIDVPATFVTSVCFCRDRPGDVIVTTADNRDDPSLGGCVLRATVGVNGAPVPMVGI